MIRKMKDIVFKGICSYIKEVMLVLVNHNAAITIYINYITFNKGYS